MTANGERLQDRWKAATLERPAVSAGRAEHFLKLQNILTFFFKVQKKTSDFVSKIITKKNDVLQVSPYAAGTL